jgi:hypothetical protein
LIGDSTHTTSPRGGSVRSSITRKVLMPLVATAASAAASYVARRAPAFLENTVLPRLREATSGAGGVARDLPDRAKSAATGAGDLAVDVTQKAKSVAIGQTSSPPASGGGRVSARQVMTSGERERQRNERAKHRAARRQTSTS